MICNKKLVLTHRLKINEMEYFELMQLRNEKRTNCNLIYHYPHIAAAFFIFNLNKIFNYLGRIMLFVLARSVFLLIVLVKKAHTNRIDNFCSLRIL